MQLDLWVIDLWVIVVFFAAVTILCQLLAMKVCLAFAVATAAAAHNTTTTGAEPLKCGIASAVFSQNPLTAATAVASGKLAFWWNWASDFSAIDTTHWDAATAKALQDAFVPMLWGTAAPPSWSFMAGGEGSVMGWNEPDLYGPACCNCDGKQSYYPATSSGWAPSFNPGSAVGAWSTLVSQLAAHW